MRTGRFRQGLSLGVVGNGSYDFIQESDRRLIFLYLQMARFEDKELNKLNNQLINLASAPRSTKINASHGHATTIKEDEIKGQWFLMLLKSKRIMVLISEVNIANGQYERSVKGAIVDKTSIEANDKEGILVPISEVNIVEGQYERSVEGPVTTENESDIFEVEIKDTIDNEMLQSIDVCPLPLGTLDVPFQGDSSDLGSLDN